MPGSISTRLDVLLFQSNVEVLTAVKLPTPTNPSGRKNGTLSMQTIWLVQGMFCFFCNDWKYKVSSLISYWLTIKLCSQLSLRSVQSTDHRSLFFTELYLRLLSLIVRKEPVVSISFSRSLFPVFFGRPLPLCPLGAEQYETPSRKLTKKLHLLANKHTRHGNVLSLMFAN